MNPDAVVSFDDYDFAARKFEFVVHPEPDRPTNRLNDGKVAPDGRTFIGPDGPPGDLWDREILAYEQDIITTRCSDPEVVQRYGTMVFVRCK